MKIYCHKCESSKVIKKTEYKRGNKKVYCYCNPDVPFWMSPKSKEQVDLEQRAISAFFSELGKKSWESRKKKMLKE